MHWREAIEEGFGPPRNDEPADLRRDIVNELNDHLVCAMRREALKTDDERVAHHAVLERFGNPKQLARRLWWDAMKEQVMKDRIVIAGVAILVLVSIGSMMFAWQAFQQGREVNVAILTKLEQLSAPQAKPKVAANWAKVTFRLRDEKTGVPVAKARIRLQGDMFSVEGTTLEKHTDDKGEATFGPILPGEFEYTIYNVHYLDRNTDRIILYPGQLTEVDVPCPSAQPEADISLSFSWPEDLRDKGLLLYCPFSNEFKFEDHTWFDRQHAGVYLLADGTISENVKIISTQVRTTRGRTKRSYLFDFEDGLQTGKKVLHRPAAQYVTRLIRCYAPADPPHDAEQLWQEIGTHSYPHNAYPIYEAKAGQPNVWTIDLPEAFLEEVRAHFAKEATPETAPSVGAGPRRTGGGRGSRR